MHVSLLGSTKRLIAAAMALLVVGALLFLLVSHKAAPESVTIHPETFRHTITVSGSVVAKQDVDLGFAQSGRISAVYAQVGDQVQAGTLLAEIENSDVRAAIAQKKAVLAEQEANLRSLQSGTRSEQLAVTQATVTGDQAALSQADQALSDVITSAYTTADSAVHNTLDSFIENGRSTSPTLSFVSSDSAAATQFLNDRVYIEQALGTWDSDVTNDATSSISQKDTSAGLSQVADLLQQANVVLNAGVPSVTVPQSTLTTWVANVATARASIDAALSAVTAAEGARTAAQTTLDRDQKNLLLQQAGSTQDSIAAQQAVVSSAQADLENAQAQLQKTQVLAPFAGTVTRMDAKVGAIVSPADSQISMMSNGLFQIDCYVPEVQFEGLAVGEHATTTLEAYGPSVTFPASVVAIDPAETMVDGVPTYKTTLQFLVSDPRIRSGMTADVEIETASIPNALVVPQGSVFSKDGSQYVQVIRGGITSDVAVQEGQSGVLGNVQITSGLQDGDRVILNPDTSR